MKTEIVFILDKSGSMNSIRTDAIGGFNAFLDDQKTLKDDTTMTLVTFDSNYHKVFEDVKLDEVNNLTEKDYVPSSMTALYDAIGFTIESVTNRKTEDSRVLCCILTDGSENKSMTYTQEAIFNMIDECKKTGWEFIFLAANQDSMKSSKSLNISADNTMSFSATTDGLSNTYNLMSKATKMYRTSSGSSHSDLISKSK